jgi:hypothetical protein
MSLPLKRVVFDLNLGCPSGPRRTSPRTLLHLPDGPQIWIALSVYLVLAIVRKRLKLELNLYPMSQILSLSLFEKPPLLEAFSHLICTGTDPWVLGKPQPQGRTIAYRRRIVLLFGF